MTARISLFLSLVSIGLIAPATLTAADAPDRFSREIAPIFVKRCLECHSEREASGKLVLIDKASLAKGGESGPAVVARSPDQSNLLARVVSGEMPPPKRGHSQKLSDAEINSLRDWIASGADWPEGRKLDLYEATTEVRGGRDWWSLQPVKRPVIPNLTNLPKQELIHSPVDAFIQTKLNATQMQPAPPADRATLIKRVSFDLLGLPPTFEEVQDFVADTAPDAYERLVDRLLASPHFGERWGRYWLDVSAMPTPAATNVTRKSHSPGNSGTGSCRPSMPTSPTINSFWTSWRVTKSRTETKTPSLPPGFCDWGRGTMNRMTRTNTNTNVWRTWFT